MSEYGPDVTIDNPAFIHPTAQIYGKVTVHEGASIWPYAVIRAENHEVVVGAGSNIQDFAMVHVGDMGPTIIGPGCSITHHCTVHGAILGENCLIGINATLMDGVRLGDNCTVGAGAVVTRAMQIPANSVVAGIPAKVVKTRNDYVANKFNAFLYERNARAYAKGDHRHWDSKAFLDEANVEMKRLQAEFAALDSE